MDDGAKRRRPRHPPLERQLKSGDQVKKRSNKPSKGKKRLAERTEGPSYVDSRVSEKILKQAREQLEEETGGEAAVPFSSANAAPTYGAGLDHGSDDEPEDGLSDEEGVDPDKDYFEELEIAPEDEAAVLAFLNPEGPGTRNLADIVMAKIREAEAGLAPDMAAQAVEARFHPKVLEVYRGVGNILAHYTSGKLPKPFKIIPSVNNWEELVFLTKPENWTPAATYHATVIFSSNLGPAMCQRFYHLILLPNVRTNIATSTNKKLHPLLFRALRKSLFKPSAFFRGILLPMAEGGDCTLREAVVLGAIVSSMTIPPIHASAAILKLCKMTHYSGPTSLFLRCLLNKKYALAYRVIDAVVNHFLSFRAEHRTLPVLWHQALLTFVQRYKQDITEEQKEALKPLLKQHTHALITPEIRRELFQFRSKRVVESMDVDEPEDKEEDDEEEEEDKE